MANFKLLFLFLTIGIFSFVACEEDEETDDNKETINLGLIVPMTPYPEYSQQIVYAAELAVNEINSNGGLLGKDFKLVIEDDEGNVDISIAKANKLIDEDKAVSLTLTSSSRYLEVFNEVLNTKDALMISPSTTAPEISSLDDRNLVFRTVPSDAFQGKIAANYVNNNLNILEVTTLCVDNSYGNGLTNEFVNQFEGTLLNKYTYESKADYSDFDFTPILDSLFESKPEFIYMISQSITETNKIFTQINLGNYFIDEYKPLIMVGDAQKRESLFDNSPSAISNGIIGTVASSVLNEEFNTNFLNFSGDTLKMNDANGMYDAIYLMAYAILSSESADPNVFKNKMQEVSKDGETIGINKFAEAKALIENGTDINYEGASGKIDFDDNGDVTSGVYEIWRVENEAFIIDETISFP